MSDPLQPAIVRCNRRCLTLSSMQEGVRLPVERHKFPHLCGAVWVRCCVGLIRRALICRTLIPPDFDLAGQCQSPDHNPETAIDSPKPLRRNLLFQAR